MGHIIKGVGVCSCGCRCWVQELKDDDDPGEQVRPGPCSGEMRVVEDYPGVYTHFCSGHGHPEDPLERQAKEKP